MRPGVKLPPGFTLIELLVALAAMAVMAVMSWQGIDAMFRSQMYNRDHSHQVLTLQTGLLQWVADLDAQTSIAGMPSLDWNGRTLRVLRLATPASDGFRVVAWTSRVEAGQAHWLRWQSPALRQRGELQDAWLQAALWGQNPGDAQKKREVMITPLEQWQVFYFRQNAWTNPLSSGGVTGNASVAPSTPSAPDGVRLVLTLPAKGTLSGQVTRDWVRPSWSVGKS